MSLSVHEWEKFLIKSRAERGAIRNSLREAKTRIKALNKRIDNIEKARGIIIEVARETQRQLEYRVGEVVSLALSAVFDQPYEFELEFEEKRGKTEARLWLTSVGKKSQSSSYRFDPLLSTGGGVVDICAFALRVALWSLKKPRSRNVLVLDEPFRFLSRSLQPSASMMMKEVSEKLGLQILMVSHSEDLIEGADRVVQIEKKRTGVSTVSPEKEEKGAGKGRKRAETGACFV